MAWVSYWEGIGESVGIENKIAYTMMTWVTCCDYIDESVGIENKPDILRGILAGKVLMKVWV